MALAVTIFDGGNHHIERGEWFLQLEPGTAPAARGVKRFGPFYDDAFMAGGQRAASKAWRISATESQRSAAAV